jgi:hypothetical protein
MTTEASPMQLKRLIGRRDKREQHAGTDDGE